MTGYALVKDGEVVQVLSSLPKNYANITGFDNFDAVAAKEHGFRPYTYIQPEYDAFTQRLGETTFEITADAVIGTRQILELEEAIVVEQKTRVGKDVIDALNQVLYNTDWTQMSASGLTVGQVAAYAGLRASIAAAKPKVANLTAQNADATAKKIAQVIEASRNRLANMPNSLTLLKTALDNLA